MTGAVTLSYTVKPILFPKTTKSQKQQHPQEQPINQQQDLKGNQQQAEVQILKSEPPQLLVSKKQPPAVVLVEGPFGSVPVMGNLCLQSPPAYEARSVSELAVRVVSTLTKEQRVGDIQIHIAASCAGKCKHRINNLCLYIYIVYGY